MDGSRAGDVEATLGRPEVHGLWEGVYRTPANERFFEEAFDYIAALVRGRNVATVLDAGCGTAAHAIRLAKRGFAVVGLDFSDHILRIAESNIRAAGCDGRITLMRGNLLSLDFPDGAFDCIVCWGVLMHIPDVDRAIAELVRVLRKGGVLVISEGNMHSLEAMGLGFTKRILKMERASVTETPAGLEYWTQTPAGDLLTRHANIAWLKKTLEAQQMQTVAHRCGQFTEIYRRASPALLANVIHHVNRLWFRYAGTPFLAFGNLLIVQKRA